MSEDMTTETLESAIALAAIFGLSWILKAGWKIPIAIGMRTTL
jgi:hypothetical protein